MSSSEERCVWCQDYARYSEEAERLKALGTHPDHPLLRRARHRREGAKAYAARHHDQQGHECEGRPW